MRRLIALILIGFLSLPSVAAAQTQATPLASPAATDPWASCAEHGGVVRERVPVLGTNNPATQIQLAGSRMFCEFTGGEGAEPADSWIAIDLDSLVATEPSLAVLAYLTKPPLPETTNPSANPASMYCAHLGGAEIGTLSAVGGGWVTNDTDTPIDVLQACMFPDGSIIDSWGITYHTDGTIRGADLTPVLGYQDADPPLVFPG